MTAVGIGEPELRRRRWVRAVRPVLRRPWESRAGWEAIIVYTAVALVLGRHTIAHAGSVFPGINIPDSWELNWPFEWFPYALIHGLNPWYTHAQWSPTGLNIAAATSFPLLALVCTPITLIWGPVVSANLVSLGAIVVTGWATYLLCRYVSKDRVAALVGGATVACGSYVLLQMWAGHALMTVFFCPQFAALAVLRYLDGAIGRRRVTVELTLCLVIEMFISTEIFATMSLFGGVLLLLGCVFGTSDIRAGIRSLIIPLAIAYGVTLVVSADYLYWLLKGAPAYAAGIGAKFPTDALAYVVPTNLTWVGGPQFASVYNLFDWDSAESDAYLGLPLILITVRWLCTRLQTRLARFLAAAVAISVLWTLGSTLYVAGKPTIWLPYRLVAGLPLIKMILEGRMAVYTELVVAVIVTLWLADRKRGTGVKRAMKWAAALVAASFLIPNLVNINPYLQSNRAIPAFFATDMYRSYIKRGATVLPINWGFSSPSLMWQADDGLYYNLASGYFTLSFPPGWTATQTVTDLWNNQPQAGDGAGLRLILEQHHVDDVVVDPADMPLWSHVLRAAGLKHPLSVGGIYLYKGPWSSSGSGHVS
jgi:hypothetical protein